MSSNAEPGAPPQERGTMPLMSHTPVFLGLRYLFRKKLSYLAMIAVAVSVGTLIVVMSVMTGFEQQLRSVVRGYLSDVTVQPQAGTLHGLEDWRTMRQRLLGMEHVEAAAPYVQGPGLMRVPRVDHMAHVMFRGMDPQLEPAVTKFGSEFVQHGGLEDLNRTYVDENGAEVRACLVGSQMARQWSTYYGLYDMLSERLEDPERSRVLKMMSEVRAARRMEDARAEMEEVIAELAGIDRNLAGLVRMNSERALRDEIVLITATEDLRRRLRKYVVAGIFETGRFDYDSGVVLLSLESAMDFARSEGGVTGLNLALEDFSKAPEVKKNLPAGLTARTWEDQQRNFLEAVEMERMLMGLILSFVGLLAGFCIFAILIMTVYEKRRDIGILKSVGYTPGYIATVFLVDGGAVGLLGAVVGVVGGLLFAGNINSIADFIERTTGWTPFPEDVYYFTRIPADTGLLVPLIIAAGALLCSLVFSVVPAIKAARMDPVDTLRFE